MQLSRSATKKCVTTTVFILGIVTIATLPTRAQNDEAPVAYASAVTTTAGIAVNGLLQGSDPDSGGLTFAIDVHPEHGSVVVTDAATGTFTYTPAPGFAGYDPFTFSVSDGASTTTATEMMFVVTLDAGSTSVVERISVSSTGEQGNEGGNPFDITADGRIVVFLSTSSNLVENDTNGVADVFIRDRDLQTTMRVSVASDGTQANGGSIWAGLSADGRFVVFESAASNLVPGDTNGYRDIFVHDRQTAQTTRVSIASDGTQGNGVSTVGQITADGNSVLFHSGASNFAADDTNGFNDVFVHNRETGTTVRVNPNNVQVNLARITPDGRYVGMNSGSIQFGATGYLHDRRTGQTVTDGAGFYSQSADGRYAAFISFSPLTPGDTNNSADVFVRDRQTGQVTQASVNSLGTLGNRMSSTPLLSADGRFVWFDSLSNNLDPVDWDTASHNFRRDMRYGSTIYVSARDGGVTADIAAGSRPYAGVRAVSANGRAVLTMSEATDLVSGDTNGYPDAFVITSTPYPAADAWDSDGSQREDVGTRGYMQSTHPRRMPVTYSFLSLPAVGTMTLINAATGEYLYMPPADFDGTVSWTFKATTADGIDSDVGRMSLSMTPVNDAPRITSIAATSTSPMVGTEVQVTLQWHDVDDGGPFTAYADWGDGSPQQTVTVAPSAQTFVHRYTRVGTYQAGFRIADTTTTSMWHHVGMTVGLLPGPGSYLRFNAVELDRVTVSNSGNVAAGPITVAAWLRTTASNADMIALSKGPSGADQWRLWRGRTGNEMFFMIGGTTTQVSARSIPQQGTDGAWHHYAGVWDGTTVRLYIDGYETMTMPATQTQAMRTSTDPICIGSSSSKGKCGSVPWRGDIGTAGVWNRALTASEIVALSRRESFPGATLQRAALWQINEGTGQTLDDSGVSNRDGLLGATTKVETFDPTWHTGN
jgi:hypothetical protein